jgi:hypothetical protein
MLLASVIRDRPDFRSARTSPLLPIGKRVLIAFDLEMVSSCSFEPGPGLDRALDSRFCALAP